MAPVASGGLDSVLCLTAQAPLPCWPSLPVSRRAAWVRWTRSSRTISFPCLTRICLPMALERVLGADPPDCLWARDGVLCGCRGEIQLAMRLAYERLKHVIEPSSAVALVPLFRQGNQFVSKRVGGMLTGSNGSGCGHGHVWTGSKLCSNRRYAGYRATRVRDCSHPTCSAARESSPGVSGVRLNRP